MSSVAFTSATTVEAALIAVAGGARPVAGGTDLVVGARSGKSTLPSSIVAIHRIDELRGVESLDEGGLRLGALASHAEIAASADIEARFTALRDACAIVGSHATRAQGTVGGNLMNASPAMETGGPLLCFDASVTLVSSSGSRSVAIEELWEGPGRTTAKPDELLVSIEVPAPAEGTGSAYLRLEYRRQMEIAVVGATAVVTVTDGVVTARSDRHDRPVTDDQAGTRRRGRPRRQRRRCCSDRDCRSSRCRGRNPDLRRAGLGGVPTRDGGGDRPARDRNRARAGTGGRLVKVAVTLNVNGASYPVELDPGTNLLAAVRDVVGLTGSKEGCDDSECGACMMLLDGQPVNSCSYLALQAEGSEVTTVEGLADGGTLAPLQAAFLDLGGVQCGFCTPGMLVSATALLAENPSPTEDEVRIGLSGNLCRCTGYDGIVKAVLSVSGR